MSWLKRSHDGEISLKLLKDLPAEAFELVRMWVSAERSYVAIGRPERWSPELVGSLLVECAHTAAWAYADQMDLSVEETLAAIWRGFDEERERLKDGD
jgi:hypothetical protein